MSIEAPRSVRNLVPRGETGSPDPHDTLEEVLGPAGRIPMPVDDLRLIVRA
jgi:hypothetical protein